MYDNRKFYHGSNNPNSVNVSELISIIVWLWEIDYFDNLFWFSKLFDIIQTVEIASHTGRSVMHLTL